MLLLLMLKGVLTEFTFGIWVNIDIMNKHYELTLWIILVWLIKWLIYKKKKKLFIYEINGLTYYQKNRDVMLNRVKDIMKIIKKD